MRVVLFANTDWYLYNFRRPLIHALIARGVEVHLASPDTGYGSRLRAEGLNWTAFPMRRRSTSPIDGLATILRFSRYLRRVKPDLLHNFTLKCVINGSLAAKLSKTPRVINSLDGLGYVFADRSTRASLVRAIVRPLLRVISRSSQTLFIVQNDGDRKTLVERRCVALDRIRFFEGGVGVDVDTFHPSVTKIAAPTVLFASRLLLDKGIREFVEAAKVIHAEGLAASFVVAGSIDPGNPGSATAEMVEAWKALGFVKFMGHVDDVATFMASASVLVLVTEYGEGLPRVLMEGAACGLPLVASNHPSCRGIVTDGDNGFVVPPRNITALSNALRKLVVDPALRERMGRSSRTRAEQQFDVRVTTKSALSVYDELAPAS